MAMDSDEVRQEAGAEEGADGPAGPREETAEAQSPRGLSEDDLDALRRAQQIIETHNLEMGLSLHELIEDAEAVYARAAAVRVEKELMAAAQDAVTASKLALLRDELDPRLRAADEAADRLKLACAQWTRWGVKATGREE